MNNDEVPKRLILTSTKDEYTCLELTPISNPTTPTSCLTIFDDDGCFENSFDSYVFEEYKDYSYSPGPKKEVKVEELFKRTLPTSLVSQKCPSLSFSSCNSSKQNSPSKIEFTPRIKVLKSKKVKRKDYIIPHSDRPLTSSRLSDILFNEIIENKGFKCPCKKLEKSFACFTARDWINISFELNNRAQVIQEDVYSKNKKTCQRNTVNFCSSSKIIRTYEYQRKKEIYESLIRTSAFGSFSTASSDNSAYETLNEKRVNCKEQILKDIPRTFSNLDIFNYASVLQGLYRILYSYFIYDPQLGYTQGMNLLVGALLIHAEENVAFWLFVTLIEDYEVRDVFSDSMRGIQKHCKTINNLVGIYLPRLSAHFDEHDIQIEMFASPWILSLFCSIIPVPFLHCFLTRFFKEKWIAFYRVCISILSYLQPKILRTRDLTEFFDLFKSLKMDQDFIEYENRKYSDNQKIVDILVEWRTIIKNSDKDYSDIQNYIVYES